MKTIAVLLLGFLGFSVFSQQKPPSPAEIEMLLKKIQRQSDSVRNDPKYKKYTDNPQQAPKSISDIVPASVYVKKADTAFLARIKMPGRNAKAIASIPSTPVTRPELISFIRDMKGKFTKAF
jgi:hypothetical protein